MHYFLITFHYKFFFINTDSYLYLRFTLRLAVVDMLLQTIQALLWVTLRTHLADFSLQPIHIHREKRDTSIFVWVLSCKELAADCRDQHADTGHCIEIRAFNDASQNVSAFKQQQLFCRFSSFRGAHARNFWDLTFSSVFWLNHFIN